MAPPCSSREYCLTPKPLHVIPQTSMAMLSLAVIRSASRHCKAHLVNCPRVTAQCDLPSNTILN